MKPIYSYISDKERVSIVPDLKYNEIMIDVETKSSIEPDNWLPKDPYGEALRVDINSVPKLMEALSKFQKLIILE